MAEMGLEVAEVAMADPGLQIGTTLTITLLSACVLQSDVVGTETNIGRSPGIGADLPVAAAAEVVMTWGSEVPRTGVDLGMVTGMTSGDHPGDLQGDKYLPKSQRY